MGLIFLGSTDLLAASHTSRFIEPLLRWLSRGRLRPEEIAQIHFLIRKMGHFTEYAVLAALLWNALRLSTAAEPCSTPSRGGRIWYGGAFCLATLYAAGDEFHQSFIPTRTASVRDVMIDSVGACGGLLVVAACRRIRRRWAEDFPRPDKS